MPCRGKVVVAALSLLTAACSSGSSSTVAASSPTSGGAAGSGAAPTAAAATASAAGAAAATSGSAAGAASAASAAGSPAGASGGVVKDPCALITESDAAPVVGGKVAPTPTEFTGIYQSCTYANGGSQLTVTSRLISRAGFEASIKANPGAVKPLPGVCQDAYSAGSVVLAWKSGTEVDSRLFGSTGDPVAAGKSLVAAACSRL